MKLKHLASEAEFQTFYPEFHDWHAANEKWITSQDFFFANINRFSVRGKSFPGNRLVNFAVEQNAIRNGFEVNWRETLYCPKTHLNNRSRAVTHILATELQPRQSSRIWICEQVTPLYGFLKKKFNNVIGSEFLGPDVKPGFTNNKLIRHESITGTSFESNSLDLIISLDVLEHVPNYIAAFRESARILRPGGKLLWTAPFIAGKSKNTVRATLENGEVVHHLEPEFHGDPLTQVPILCYTVFGWEVLEQMRECGFQSAHAICYTSIEYGYFSVDFAFVGAK